MGDGGIVIGNLRRPLEEVKSKLEAKIAQAYGREVDLWFLQETVDDQTKQVRFHLPEPLRFPLHFSPEVL